MQLGERFINWLTNWLMGGLKGVVYGEGRVSITLNKISLRGCPWWLIAIVFHFFINFSVQQSLQLLKNKISKNMPYTSSNKLKLKNLLSW